MTEVEISNCDFTKPRHLTGDANRALSSWQANVCNLLTENWQALLGSEFRLRLARTDVSTGHKAVSELLDPGYGARIVMGGDSFPSIMAFSDRVLLALVLDMLGSLGEEWPEVRELTPAEVSLVELLFGEIARSVSQAWPEIEPLECELRSVVRRPRRGRLFDPDAAVVRTRLVMETPFGPDEAIWLLPQTGLASIGIRETAPEIESLQPAPEMRGLAKMIPVELVVKLGQTSLSLAEMNQLKVGDFLTLDQGVFQPLQAMVDGRLQWLGTPCRLGNRQGFQIMASRGESGQ